MKVNTCTNCRKDFWTSDNDQTICFTCSFLFEREKPAIVMPALKIEPVVHDEITTEIEVGYVYIMKSGRYCKIGMTTRKSGRLNEIKGLFPVLKLVHQIACIDHNLTETYLHNKFKKENKRVKREWYLLTKEDLDWFKSLKDYDLDEVSKTVKRY